MYCFTILKLAVWFDSHKITILQQHDDLIEIQTYFINKFMIRGSNNND